MATPGGQGVPYGGVPYGRPGAPSSGVAEGTSPHAVPYGDSAQHMAKEAHQLRPPPSGVMAQPPSTQSKPNGPTVNGSWAHLGGGYTNGPASKVSPHQQQVPSLSPAGVPSSRINQSYQQPGSSPLVTPTTSGPVNYTYPNTSQAAPPLRGGPQPPVVGFYPPASQGSSSSTFARVAPQQSGQPPMGPPTSGSSFARPTPVSVPSSLPSPPVSGSAYPVSTPSCAFPGPPTLGVQSVPGMPPPVSSNQHPATSPQAAFQGQLSASTTFRPVMGPAPPVSGPPLPPPLGTSRLPGQPPAAAIPSPPTSSVPHPPSSQFSGPPPPVSGQSASAHFQGLRVPGVASSGVPSPPVSLPATQSQGYGPPPGSMLGAPQLRQGFPGPPPTSAAQAQALHGRPSYPQQPGYSHSSGTNSMQPPPPPLYNTQQQQQQQQQQPTLEPPMGGVPGYDPELHSRMSGLSVNASFNKLWGYEACNLLQTRNILPKAPEDPPKPSLPGDNANCSPDIFRCTLTKIPETQSLLQKARLPLGVLIHPFRDVNHLPVIQSSTIVRCRSCRAYINPYVQFVERQKWKCNICFRINPLPDDFMYDPSTKKYGEPERRPEVRHATVEFIAPTEYMLRPPQPAAYLFVLDVSHGAIQTGYLSSFCKVLLEELDNIPGDSRTQVGFVTFDSSVHFYNLGEGLSQPQMLLVSDIDDVFVPSPDSLLVNIHESKALVQDLLTNLPSIHAQNGETTSALGAAVQAAYKLVSPIGGRVSVFQTCLPNAGPGSLKPREDPNQRAAKEIMNLLPATDFYKKLALDCSGQQVAVDVFLMGAQYMDVASIACISKYSAGCISYYPGLHSIQNRSQVEKFEAELRYYITRKIGFEAVMRIRCTKGLVIHTFHGNFFVRSTDLLSLPNVNPDAGFGMQIAIEESLADCNLACFQAAVLYTSSRGERRIRVHTLCLPVTAMLQDILGSVDQEAVMGMLCKMAVDRSLSSSVVDAREAMVNACLDLIQAFKTTLNAGQAAALGLPIPHCARLVPLYVLALMKHTAFRVGISTKLDERVFAMEQMKMMPLSYLMTYIYPALYPLHMLDDQDTLELDDGTLVCQPPRLQLSFENIDRHGCYALDTVDRLYLYVSRALSDRFCTNVLGVPNFAAIPEDMNELPQLETEESERVRNFLSWTQSRRPFYSPLWVIREDSKDRHLFVQHMVDDRTESALSYYEFLQHLKQQLSK
ncbi:protein transport protein Sec24A isoform X2 [Rhipicephalus sanguineus]|uniref:protein transport protein Sec24A isoform X2 n=1 Tax=Rhipicephalus sanguineus TaxID=34632 RepID=UPI00189501D5|nr:protein transport protein Sec24A isoform X2 [Rhipicephalus sanguineus]